MIHNVFYKIQKTKTPEYVMSVHIPWRKLSYVLDHLSEQNIDIRKAHIRKNTSTLFITRNDEIIHITDMYKYMKSITLYETPSTEKRNKIVLPKKANIYLYTMPETSYTVLEFNCSDRIGLLADMMDLLVQFPYEITNGYINTIGNYAHNMFFLQKDGKPLEKKDIEYISNTFEYDIKSQVHVPEYFNPSE